MKTSNDIIIKALRENYDDLKFALELPIRNLTDAVDGLEMNADNWPEEQFSEEQYKYIKRIKHCITELKELTEEA